jgi:hypothetical protein
MSFGNPGRFSISFVIVSRQSDYKPPMTNGDRATQAADMTAVRPAHPLRIITTVSTSLTSGKDSIIKTAF